MTRGRKPTHDEPEVVEIPKEVAEAIGRLERKRIFRDEFESLLDFADDERKRRLETF